MKNPQPSKSRSMKSAKTKRKSIICTSNKPKNKHEPKKPSKGAPNPSYQAKEINIAEIIVGDQHRPINPKKLDGLVESVGKIGLRNPIWVRKVKGVCRLVSGLHRLEAAKILGRRTIPCIYFHGGKTRARMWQISENLHRAGLTQLDESNQTVEWLELLKVAGTADQKLGKKQAGRPEGGIAKAARELPLKAKTDEAKRKEVERKLKISRIDPKAQAAIREAGFEDSQSKLLKVADAKNLKGQLKVVEQLKTGGRPAAPKTGDDLGPMLTLPAMQKAWERATTLKRAWERASDSLRKHFIVEVMKYRFES